MIRVEDAGIKLLGASLGIVPCRARFVGRFVAFSTFVSTTSGLFFGQAGALLGTGPLVPYLVGGWLGYSLAGVIFWRGEVKRALKFVQAYPRLMEHALLTLEFGRPRRVPDVQVRTRHGPGDLGPRGRVLAVAPDRADELARPRRAEGRAVRAEDRRRETGQARPGGHREPVKT